MKTIHLQGIGQHPATEAKNLKPGMVTVWNYGFPEKVVSVEPTKSGKSLNFVLEAEDGKKYKRRMNSDTLVGVALPPAAKKKKK